MRRSTARKQVVYTGTPTTNISTPINVIQEWTPDRLPVHCSNCLHCKVSRDSAGLEAHCAKGYGSSKPLSTVIRASNPRGFKDANKCQDFRSMD